MPDLAIIDGHHHIWRQADLPWLMGPEQPRIFGPYAAIRRDYDIDEYSRNAGERGIVKSIYVQTNWKPKDAVEETRWVQSVADVHGFPHAIVSYANLADPDLTAVLDGHAACANFRGVRQQLHWHENPLYRFEARADLMNGAGWRKGFAEVAERGLVFELQVFTSQMADGASLAAAFPNATLVLEHAGMLEDTSVAGIAAWREGMRRLADQPNMNVKLSGLGTFIHAVDPAAIAEIVGETVAMFGAERCLFGSNFPIESLWTTYGDLTDAHLAATIDMGEAARRNIFHDTAARLYRL